jgi:GDP-mannose pyrophosphatase NudK
VHFFAAEYDESQRQNAGGGVEDEDIDVLEVPFTEALAMIKDGRIRDGKTIMLLQYAQIQGWLA